MSQSPFTTSLYRERLQGALGACLTMVLTCSVAGIIATAASSSGVEDISWTWATAWLLHLVVAWAGLWGLVVICVHLVCLVALIQRLERTVRVIAVAFLFQLTTSAIVLDFYDDVDADIQRRLLLVSVACVVPVITFLIGSYLKSSRAVAVRGDRCLGA